MHDPQITLSEQKLISELGKSVQLTNGGCALVSEEDYERVVAFRWYQVRKHRVIYVKRTSLPTIYLHQFILSDADQEVDHRNSDGLDNRRSNLRRCTRAQNQANKRPQIGRQYKGVSLNRHGRWAARIKAEGQTYYIGQFDAEVDAAKAYDAKARELFGEFARLNFPDVVDFDAGAARRQHRAQSRYPGVSPCRGKWRAVTTIDRKSHFLGDFEDESEAWRAVCVFRKERQAGPPGPWKTLEPSLMLDFQ